MAYETEPLLGMGYTRRQSQADALETVRRDSTASAVSTSSRHWGWRDNDPAPVHAPPQVEATVGGSTEAKKPRGLAALVKRFNDMGRERRRQEKEWARPPIFGTAYGYC